MPRRTTTLPGTTASPASALPEDELRQLILSRFSYGHTPELEAEVVAAGGALDWFDNQLDHLNIPDPDGDQVLDMVPDYPKSPPQVRADFYTITPACEAQLVGYNFWRRIRSSRQVFEVMHDFWRNHFYITINENKQMVYFQGQFDRTVREHALGSVVDLIKGVETSPLMLLYLDCINQPATNRPNENLAREMLELHTVGIGNFTESDVKNLARLLTGYTHQNDGYVNYDIYQHQLGPLQILTWSAPNAAYNGQALIPDFLEYLGTRPATQTALARKLARKFVSDDPSTTLVSDLVDVLASSGYSIKETLRALVRHPEFQQSAGAKVKTPQEELIHVMRTVTKDFTGNQSFDSTTYQTVWNLEAVGNLPYGWPMPNGYSVKNNIWSSSQRLLWSSTMHFQTPRDTWIYPTYSRNGLQLKARTDYFPDTPGTMADLVEYLARTITGLPATADQKNAVSTITQIPLSQAVEPATLSDTQWTWTLATIFDSPQFMTR